MTRGLVRPSANFSNFKPGGMRSAAIRSSVASRGAASRYCFGWRSRRNLHPLRQTRVRRVSAKGRHHNARQNQLSHATVLRFALTTSSVSKCSASNFAGDGVGLPNQLLQRLAALHPVPRSLPNRCQAACAAITPPAWSINVALRRISNRRPLSFRTITVPRQEFCGVCFSSPRPDRTGGPVGPASQFRKSGPDFLRQACACRTYRSADLSGVLGWRESLGQRR